MVRSFRRTLAACLLLGSLLMCTAKSAQCAQFAGDPMPPGLIHPISPPGTFDTPPKLVHGFLPWYPLRQLQQRKPGEVTVEFNVGADGKTSDIKIMSSTAYGFWKYTQWAVEKWKFSPALKKGHPVVVRARVTFHFNS